MNDNDPRIGTTSWMPDRKILAGGLSSVVAFFGIVALQRYAGITMEIDVAMALVGAAGSLAAYVVPPSAQDVIKRLDSRLTDSFKDLP